MEFQSMLLYSTFFMISSDAAVEDEVKMLCRPKSGCQFPSCDRPTISPQLLAAAKAAGLNIESLQEDNEYSITCQPSSVLDLFSSLANVEGKAGQKGKKGMPGPRGVQGPKGVDGMKGEIGDEGLKGTAGQKGDKGEVGISIQGPKGNTGARAVGIQGPKGSPGDQGLPGPTGPAGKKGATGPRGARGPPGPRGSCTCFQNNHSDRGP